MIKKISICKGLVLLMSAWACEALAISPDAMEAARVFILKKQYVQSIGVCKDIIDTNPKDKNLLAEAHYLSGLSYLNLFDFSSAKRSFQSILDVYPQSARTFDAQIVLSDIRFLQEDYEGARNSFETLVKDPSSKKRKAYLYARLAECYRQLGDKDKFEYYSQRLHQEYPRSPEAHQITQLKQESTYYTVQVGAFSNYDNAGNFIKELKAKGYEVYSVTCLLAGKKMCRIRVGNCTGLKQAEDLKSRLEGDGYNAKIFPKME